MVEVPALVYRSQLYRNGLAFQNFATRFLDRMKPTQNESREYKSLLQRPPPIQRPPRVVVQPLFPTRCTPNATNNIAHKAQTRNQKCPAHLGVTSMNHTPSCKSRNLMSRLHLARERKEFQPSLMSYFCVMGTHITSFQSELEQNRCVLSLPENS